MLLVVLALVALGFVAMAALYDWRARRRRPERATAEYWQAARAERRELRLRRTFGQ